MTGELPGLSLALIAGGGLGTLYFGGLWWTTRRLTRPGALSPFVLASFLGRLAVCLAGFVLVLNFGGLAGLVSSVAGFMMTQFVFVLGLGKKAG